MGEGDDADAEDGCVEKRRSLVEVRGSDDRDRGSFRNGTEAFDILRFFFNMHGYGINSSPGTRLIWKATVRLEGQQYNNHQELESARSRESLPSIHLIQS